MSDYSDSGGELPPEETLIHGRARRTTAGNRMGILLQAIADDDVQKDLLEDEEEDQRDYVAEDDGGDIDLESSDESEDEGPPKEGEEEKLEGEKELQKQERVEAKKKKRKAEQVLKMPPMRKRVKLAEDVSTTTSTAPDTPTAPRPRKRSERTSWLATPEDAPSRHSSRNATIRNKEETAIRLKEGHERSKRAHELMRVANERRAANAGPVLTQADRVARALKNEKENSKSLNRWVQVEEERRAAQKRKLEALRNRTIEGPVIRYWSASAIWEGDKIKVKRVHQPKVEVVAQGSGKPPAAENGPEKQGQLGAQPDPASHESTASEPLKEATVHPETASVVAELDKGSVKITNTPEIIAQTPSAPADRGEPTRIDESKEIQHQMRMDPSNPTTGKEATMIDLDAPNPDSLTTPEPVPHPPKSAASPSAPESASFLDGIHFWASQSPVEPDRKNHQSLSSNHPPPTLNAQASASASETHVPIPVDQPFGSSPHAHQHDQRPSVDLVPDARDTGMRAHHQPAAVEYEHPAALAEPHTRVQYEHPAALTEPSAAVRYEHPTVLSRESEPASFQNANQSSIAQPLQIDPPSATDPVFAAPPQYPMPSIATSASTVTPQQPGQPCADPQAAATAPPPPPPAPLLREQALRTLLTLDAFPQLEDVPAPAISTSRNKSYPATSILSSILFPEAHPTLTSAEQKYLTSRSLKKKGDNFLPDRPTKASCCITADHAKFRDPKTGLGYRDLAAFKSLQRVLAGGCTWSVGEGCWGGIIGEGRLGRVAKDVPEGFWSGEVKKKDVVKVEEGMQSAAQVKPPVQQGQVPGQVHGQTQGQGSGKPQGNAPVQFQGQPRGQVQGQVPSPAQGHMPVQVPAQSPQVQSQNTIVIE